MTAMPSAMSTRETNRLHRWAMWRMTVNEGIINCIRDNGTARVIHPDSTSDTHSVTSSEPEFHEFPFITAEQMSLARKMNLREKYGSSHGLSDDAYFIFGLPRITVGKDVPEVTSTGTRSVYGSFSDFGAAMELNNNNSSNSNNYYNHNNNHSPRGTVPVTVAEQTNMTLNLTYSELGPTPDVQSLTSHDDSEVQRINGFREGWRTPVSPVPRLNLYSIQEEFNNNNNSNKYYAGQTTDRYSSDRYYNGPAQSYNAGECHTGETTDRYHSDRYHNSSVQTYNAQDVNALYSSNWYHTRETTDRYSSDRYRAVETTDRYADRYHNSSGMQSFNAGDVSDQHSTSRHYTTSAAPSYNARAAADGYSAAPWQSDSRQDIYPPFSNSRQVKHSPMRQSYSTPPTSPSQNYSPLQVSISRRSYSPSPTSPRQSYSPTPMSPRRSYSPSSISPRESYSPSFRQIGPPSTGPAKAVGSPGYGSKTRPTTLLSDGETERLKRQAYYDWGTPSTERYIPDFASHSRYS